MNYDVVVIGAGPAGYSAAIRAAQLGARVALIENDQPGGTCLNTGCVPTKTLWHAMNSQYADAIAQKTKTVETLRKGLSQLIQSYPIDFISGSASFVSAETVLVTSSSLDARPVRFTKCIIATGSRPKPLRDTPFDHHHIIDSTDALKLAVPPATMLIIGGGVIGVELATIFARFGTQVHLCERESSLLPGEDPLIVNEVTKSLSRLGVKTSVSYIAEPLVYKDYEKVLIAVGRIPNNEDLNLTAANVVYDNRGITVNEFLETSAATILAAGDVTGRWQLAYTAQSDGCIAAENALSGSRKSATYLDVPRVIFSKPVCAVVGRKLSPVDTEKFRVGTYPFAASAMAFIEHERAGWVKIMCDKSSSIVLGGIIIGKSAEDLISLISLAVRHKLTINDLQRELFFHPSLSESVHLAAQNAAGTCVDLPAHT
ncbi:MAG: NAD(P)/FAD-dependent oxidoreductase [Endomicrobiales bacterium]|jgi:dihydrolipoamide dehydrogenase